MSTNPASSGSSYLSMGNTAVICTVHGPAEGRRAETGGRTAGAVVAVAVNIGGFSGVDRKKRGGGDRSVYKLPREDLAGCTLH